MRRDQLKTPEPMRSTLPNTDQPRIPYSEYHHIGGHTPQVEFPFSTKFDQISLFFTSLLNLIFRNNTENACLAIHFLTTQMQIKFNSKRKKSKFGLASSSLVRGLTIGLVGGQK